MATGARGRVLIIAVLLFAALAALVWFLSTRYWAEPVTPIALPPGAAVEAVTPRPAPSPPAAPAETPAQAEPGASPSPATPATPSPPPDQQTSPQASAPAPPATDAAAGSRLLIPVAGIRPEQLRDTYNEARSEGRTHNAIDIIAPRGTPVFAAADGRVVKLFQSVKGGTTVYQLSVDERLVYYYAHLDRYADGLREGHYARRGETIGYVGDTGNATPGNYHLHFQVYRITDPKRFYDGENLNPYTLLR